MKCTAMEAAQATSVQFPTLKIGTDVM